MAHIGLTDLDQALSRSIFMRSELKAKYIWLQHVSVTRVLPYQRLYIIREDWGFVSFCFCREGEHPEMLGGLSGMPNYKASTLPAIVSL